MYRYLYLLVALLALSSCNIVALAAEAHQERQKKTPAQRIEDDLQCYLLPKSGICLCLIRINVGGLESTYAGGHFPDHMCDGDEEGAIP